MRFADVVKAKRQQLKETQTEFGERFGVSPTAISFWESGQRDVPNKVLEELLELPDVRFDVCPTCSGTGLVPVKIKLVSV